MTVKGRVTPVKRPKSRRAPTRKPDLCSNCKKPFVFWREHWHCTGPSCPLFVCKPAARRSLSQESRRG